MVDTWPIDPVDLQIKEHLLSGVSDDSLGCEPACSHHVIQKVRTPATPEFSFLTSLCSLDVGEEKER